MNVTKQFLRLLFLQIFLSGLFAQASAQSKSGCAGKKPISVLFTPRMTSDDLDSLVSKLDRQSIRLTYKARKFNTAGKLTYISFAVSTADGFSGAAAANIKGQKFGFVHDCGNKKMPFAVGNL